MNLATSSDGPNRHSDRISPGADQQLPRPLTGAAHRLDGVEDQLLQLDPIAVCWH